MKDKQLGSKFMKKILSRCTGAVALASLIYALITILVNYIVHSITWQPTPLYYFFHKIEGYASILVLLVWFFMVLIIIYAYWKKAAGYFENITAASATLVHQDDAIITLPAELREIEDSMNHMKRTSLKNEREAREAEQRKNDLVVNLAHDIRTPLASVIGYLSLLDEAPDMPKEQRAKYTGITLEKANRLEQLINEFFEITRFNLSAIVLNKGRINLSFMLAQMADEFYPMLAPHGKQIVVQAPDDLDLWGDADKLSRVFNNILKNAMSYSYDNSIISIRAFSQETSIVIEFLNSGDPIPQQKLETIFERFFRLDAARSSQTGGAGLGLAIAKEIVSAHCGTITAMSDPEQTIFTVVLPMEEKSMGQSKEKTIAS